MRNFEPTKIPALKNFALRWENLFPLTEIDLELGAGAGLHAIRYAQANPGRTLVALERTSKADRMISRRQNHELRNLHVLRADAIHWIASEVPPLSIENCFILYPNPYPKSRHKNLRWHHMPFMGFLKSRMKMGGKITLATNETFYADEARQLMVEHWGFRLIEDRLIDPDTQPRTHFEKKYLARGEPCRNLVFENPAPT